MIEAGSAGSFTELELGDIEELESSDSEYEDYSNGVGDSYQQLESASSNLKRVDPGAQLGVSNPLYVFLSCQVCLNSFAINSRWVLFSNLLYFLGQVSFSAADIIELYNLEADEDKNISVSLNSTAETAGSNEFYGADFFSDYDIDLETVEMYLCYVGAVLFLLNPISDFMGSWAEERVSQIHEELHQVKTRKRDTDIENERGMAEKNLQNTEESENEVIASNKCCSIYCICNFLQIDVEEVNWDMQVARLFFIGSVLQLWQTYLDWESPDVSFYQALDITASHLFVIDASIAVFSWKLDRDSSSSGSRQRWLFSLHAKTIDWSGWGDWSFFVGSILDAAISYMDNFSEKTQVLFALTSDLLWMLNAVLYSIGYIYGQDIRKRFANSYYTNLIHVEDSVTDSDSEGDTNEPHEESDTESNDEDGGKGVPVANEEMQASDPLVK